MLVATHAIRAVTGLGGAEQIGAVAKGFGLGSALRAVSRDRAVVDVVDVDGGVVTGTIDNVGQDSPRGRGALRRPAAPQPSVLAVRAIPFAGVAMVRRR